MKLEPYQIEGTEFLAKNHHALLADEMGLGKTAQAIYAWCKINTTITIHRRASAIIVCPASVKYHWENEFHKWSTSSHPTIQILDGMKADVSVYANIIILNYELLQSDYVFKQLFYKQWDVLICDEAHYLKTLTSKRSARVLGKGGLVHNAKYKWMLTGTPIENRPVDLFPMLYVLANKVLGQYNTYEKFVMRYCNGYYDAYTGEPMPDGASNEKELGERLKSFMLRRTLENGLPEVSIQTISLQKNKKLYELEREFPYGEELYFKPMAELGSLASLRQEVALAKLPQCIEYIKDFLKVMDKVVVFAYHRSVINILEKELSKYRPVKYYGGMTIRQKEMSRSNFRNDPQCKIFIGQIQAAGIGLDGLQKACHHMLFVEVDWIPFKQCIGRLRRKGQKNKVVVQLLVCQDSIEEQMLRSVNSKLKSINKILGD